MIHGALYACLRALFGLSVIGILVSLFSGMLVYQLLGYVSIIRDGLTFLSLSLSLSASLCFSLFLSFFPSFFILLTRFWFRSARSVSAISNITVNFCVMRPGWWLDQFLSQESCRILKASPQSPVKESRQTFHHRSRKCTRTHTHIHTRNPEPTPKEIQPEYIYIYI